jgi:hypothetical protein
MSYPPWNTGLSEAREDMPRKGLTDKWTAKVLG